MAVKLVDKVLGFMGFEDEDIDQEEKQNREEVQEEPGWQRKRDRGDREKSTVVSLQHAQRQVRVVVVEPRSFEEVKEITDNLKNRRPVILNLEQADAELARRVVDFVMGATYALSGSQQKVGNGVFLFVPANMDIANELKESNREKGIFSWVRS
ncbi:Cell division protein SepF [Pelotomaculum schinkii]|uniref:Cell division protein SepF n=2 Tax=Pelotomaculum schinkii TaxID=78350 RepID=A0A4Y7RAT8_9FIRM|nr:Cell division protein SepF [Pelotomaculum schinkii]